MVKRARVPKRKPKRQLKIIADPDLSLGSQSRAIHARVERHLKTLNLPPVSCRKGCHHCCYKLVVIGLPDAFAMAEAILQAPDWRERYLPKLRETALASCDGIIEEEPWFAKHIPCPVLDTESGTCSVYGSRPTACRYHLAVTPAELCDPVLHPGALNGMVDLLSIENAVDGWQIQVSADAFGVPFVASLPIMVIHAMARLTKDPEIVEALEGIADPRSWHIDHRDVKRDAKRAEIRAAGGNPDAL